MGQRVRFAASSCMVRQPPGIDFLFDLIDRVCPAHVKRAYRIRGALFAWDALIFFGFFLKFSFAAVDEIAEGENLSVKRFISRDANPIYRNR